MELSAQLPSGEANAGRDGEPVGAAKRNVCGENATTSVAAEEVAKQERRVPTHGISGHHNLVDLRLCQELGETLTDLIN